MKIEQHRPAYVTGFENEIVEFQTSKELLNISWVKRFSDNKKFHQFSIAREEYHNALMAEYEDGKVWWVVGHIRDKDISNIDDIIEWVPND